jgi:peptidyl-prolyl cis-trans isomerase C
MQKPKYFSLSWGLSLLLLVMMFPEISCSEETPSEKVLARVNGEPIFEKEVLQGLPSDAFGITLEQVKSNKLERLIGFHMLRQFLTRYSIKASDLEVAKAVDDLRKNPPSAGCMCCRYKNLEEFLQANGFTLSELREKLRNELGFEAYLKSLWEKEHPNKKKALVIAGNDRSRLEKDYIKVSHIFFNTFQQAMTDEDYERLRREEEKKATTAWTRLEKGEGFAELAKMLSEDVFSRPNGGVLGCVPRNTFGPAFLTAYDKLKPGQYSKPVESPWGFHILKRAIMTDQDMTAILKADYLGKKREELMRDIRSKTKIERE